MCRAAIVQRTTAEIDAVSIANNESGIHNIEAIDDVVNTGFIDDESDGFDSDSYWRPVQ
jgi:hypothetical protein